jgi:hypothetical protein
MSDSEQWEPYLTLPSEAKHDVREAAQVRGHTSVNSYLRSVVLERVSADRDKPLAEITADNVR